MAVFTNMYNIMKVIRETVRQICDLIMSQLILAAPKNFVRSTLLTSFLAR